MEIITAHAIDPQTGEYLILDGTEDNAVQQYTNYEIDPDTGEYIEVED